MKVFLSWSGTTSRAVAEALGEWFPKVLQNVEPFVSAKDIDKGSNWTVELARELEDTEFGVICLAPDNLLSPWLNYEAGAITKSVNSRVCPVLFGVNRGDVKPPLAQLQLTLLEKDDLVHLMASMNKVAGELIGPAAVEEAVGVWWPWLDTKLKAITVPELPTVSDQEIPATEPAKPRVEMIEMMEEMLQRVRSLDNRIRRVEKLSRDEPDSGHLSVRTLPSSRVERLVSTLNASGLMAVTWRETSKDASIQIAGYLPEPLPDTVRDDAIELSLSGIDVEIVGVNRTAVFGAGGRTTEVPF